MMSTNPRRWFVLAGALLMLLGTLYGFGLIGTPVEESISGSLAANATLVAPATPAFQIWSVIYLGLFAYTIWQLLPASRDSQRADAIAIPAALTMVLNGVWLLVVQAGAIWLSVAVIAVLALLLGRVVQLLGRFPSGGRLETAFTDGSFGLYLGWVSIATVANVAAALVYSGVAPVGRTAEFWTVATLTVASLLGVWLSLRLGGRWAVGAAMAWGLAWIAFGRLVLTPESPVAGIAAAVAALVVLAAAPLVRYGLPHRSGHSIPAASMR